MSTKGNAHYLGKVVASMAKIESSDMHTIINMKEATTGQLVLFKVSGFA